MINKQFTSGKTVVTYLLECMQQMSMLCRMSES